MLSGLGGALGIFIAYGAIALILAVAPDDVPRIDEIHMDARVFVFALTISVVTGLLIGLLPALRLVKRDLQQANALRPVAIGLLIGVPLALTIATSLRTLLFGVVPQDVATVVATCAVLTITALLAAYLPAFRASRVDTMVALRDE